MTNCRSSPVPSINILALQLTFRISFQFLVHILPDFSANKLRFKDFPLRILLPFPLNMTLSQSTFCRQFIDATQDWHWGYYCIIAIFSRSSPLNYGESSRKIIHSVWCWFDSFYSSQRTQQNEFKISHICPNQVPPCRVIFAPPPFLCQYNSNSWNHHKNGKLAWCAVSFSSSKVFTVL